MRQTAINVQHVKTDIDPQAVPATPTDALTIDCHMLKGVVINTTAGVINFSIFDKSPTPISIAAAATPIAANGGSLSWDFGTDGLFCPNGVTWYASGVGLHGRFSFRQG